MAEQWTETVRFGTEIEIVADFDLSPLYEHIKEHVAVLRNSVDDGRHTLWLELETSEVDVDDAVQRYVALVEALPTRIRALWNESADRCLNTGIQAGVAPHAYAIGLSAESIQQAARIGLRHQFTIYAAHVQLTSFMTPID